MLRACILDFLGSWEKHLPLVEFAYNNGHHSSIRMAPYELLYERKCRTPLCWVEIEETRLIGREIVQTTTGKIKRTQKKMRTSQSCQKSYANQRRRNLEFSIGYKVYLKVSPFKTVIRGKKKGKLSPRYIGPYQILEKIRSVAYRIALHVALSNIHNVFHMSQL